MMAIRFCESLMVHFKYNSVSSRQTPFLNPHCSAWQHFTLIPCFQVAAPNPRSLLSTGGLLWGQKSSAALWWRRHRHSVSGQRVGGSDQSQHAPRDEGSFLKRRGSLLLWSFLTSSHCPVRCWLVPHQITHPAGCMSQFIRFFGEQIMVLWKLALLRRRILIFSPPPVGVVCYRGEQQIHDPATRGQLFHFIRQFLKA